MILEIEPEERNMFEDAALLKCNEILKLQVEARAKPDVELLAEGEKLTIVAGNEMSPEVPYKGVVRLGNYFAVTDYWEGVFPTNVLLKYFVVTRRTDPTDKDKDKK
jgi:hypothetical protein